MQGIKHINQAWTDKDVIELMDTHGSGEGSAAQTHILPSGFGGGRPPDLTQFDYVKGQSSWREGKGELKRGATDNFDQRSR